MYTACLLAVDPDTGKLKWHFQFTPHDLYDYDAVETPVLVDMQYHGQPRKLIIEANRNDLRTRARSHQWKIPLSHAIRRHDHLGRGH